jgi:cation:H+ antiporter
MALLFLILGLIGLVIGAHLVIRGSLNIAKHFKISQLFIGLTILAIGTDLPELVVHITGAIHRLQGIETSGLIVGETMGTCMAQITLAMGIIGLFVYLTLGRRKVIRDGIFMLVSVLLLFSLGFDGKLSRFDGIVLLLVYAVYFFIVQREEHIFDKIKRAPKMYFFWSILSIISGFAILIYCSNLVVDNGVSLASAWGVPQSVIGVLLIGLGTSLPEIVLAIGAILRKAPMLSVGNLVGSNIFDLLFTLGIGTVISEFLVAKDILWFDAPYLFLASLLVILLFFRKKGIQKKEALLLIFVYVFYAVAKLLSLY